ncbi:MAG: alpha/beta hydrolase [Thermoleophilia bacterium]|jgi:pimeloyl-ACP methyl ester carboxylesterase|nr:alpha/beta hydrolase [Thermoleophilia bacterium]
MPSLPPAIHLAYETEGEGPLVVGLHDLGKSRAGISGALKPLLSDHRLLVPDLRGHGDSPLPPGPWSIDDFASDVARLVSAEGGGAIVVGIGLGAATALALALGHPGLVAGMVLSGIGPRAEEQEGRDRWMLIARALRERGQEGQALTAEAMATRPDWRGALAQVDSPIAIVAGEEDRAVPASEQRELAIWLRGATFDPVPGAGHDLTTDGPDALAAAARRLAMRDRHPVAA